MAELGKEYISPQIRPRLQLLFSTCPQAPKDTWEVMKFSWHLLIVEGLRAQLCAHQAPTWPFYSLLAPAWHRS